MVQDYRWQIGGDFQSTDDGEERKNSRA